MTRDEKLKMQAAKEQDRLLERAFIRGAVWADMNCWIPVEDELPPLEEAVLVCDASQPERDVWFAHRTERPEVLVDKNKFSHYWEDGSVTHWMPVPRCK